MDGSIPDARPTHAARTWLALPSRHVGDGVTFDSTVCLYVQNVVLHRQVHWAPGCTPSVEYQNRGFATALVIHVDATASRAMPDVGSSLPRPCTSASRCR